jgi:hypothetical protein
MAGGTWACCLKLEAVGIDEIYSLVTRRSVSVSAVGDVQKIKDHTRVLCE